MKKDIVAIGLVVLFLGLFLWSIDSIMAKQTGGYAVFGFAGFLITLIGLVIVMYGCISKPKKVLPPPPPP